MRSMPITNGIDHNIEGAEMNGTEQRICEIDCELADIASREVELEEEHKKHMERMESFKTGILLLRNAEINDIENKVRVSKQNREGMKAEHSRACDRLMKKKAELEQKQHEEKYQLLVDILMNEGVYSVNTWGTPVKISVEKSAVILEHLKRYKNYLGL